MSYTSTISATKSALVDLLRTALATSGTNGQAVTVGYGWAPGSTDALAVFLTRPFGLEPDQAASVPVSYTAPVMQPGAMPFDETHRVDLTVWAFRPDLNSAELQEVEEQMDTVVGVILNTLADNVSVGGARWVLPGDGEQTVQPYGPGYVAVRVIPLDITARLQP